MIVKLSERFKSDVQDYIYDKIIAENEDGENLDNNYSHELYDSIYENILGGIDELNF